MNLGKRFKTGLLLTALAGGLAGLSLGCVVTVGADDGMCDGVLDHNFIDDNGDCQCDPGYVPCEEGNGNLECCDPDEGGMCGENSSFNTVGDVCECDPGFTGDGFTVHLQNVNFDDDSGGLDIGQNGVKLNLVSEVGGNHIADAHGSPARFAQRGGGHDDHKFLPPDA